MTAAPPPRKALLSVGPTPSPTCVARALVPSPAAAGRRSTSSDVPSAGLPAGMVRWIVSLRCRPSSSAGLMTRTSKPTRAGAVGSTGTSI